MGRHGLLEYQVYLLICYTGVTLILRTAFSAEDYMASLFKIAQPSPGVIRRPPCLFASFNDKFTHPWPLTNTATTYMRNSRSQPQYAGL
ncbi:uncharacterized protein TrAFT101_001593 [Trichoderma asperellum]|uniref:uncharacterized protein n=1 Tax=Trichoderma asperellum TaxID=101201 RepID=UPI00331B8922|nr:hypothetical protein TrAFT101_001593 [Trichoderma asperellum]